MSELRPKPALRVDTRSSLTSSFSHSSHPHHAQHASASTSVFNTSTSSATAAFVATSASAASDRSFDSHSPADITCSIWWDGPIVDETATMRLRRGRMTVTRLKKPSPTQLPAHTTHTHNPAAAAASSSASSPSHSSPPSSPPLELSSVQDVDVLLKSFQTRRPTAEDVQHMRYDFEAFQHLDFFASSVLNVKAGKERRRLTAPHGTGPQWDAVLSSTNAGRLPAVVAALSSTSSSSMSSASSSGGAGGSISKMNVSIPYIKPLQLLHDSVHGMALIYRDGGGRKLSDLIGTFTPAQPAFPSPTQLLAFLRCALSLTDLLGALHSAGVIYRALRPSNTLYCPSTYVSQFFDYSHSSLLSSEKQAVDKMTFPSNSLPYTAPEATGRMNRSIDTRSDLYSLGCTLMELLTGRPPFVSSDPMEVIHCHLAKHPPPVFAQRHMAGSEGAVCRMVNEIVHKLLQKPAEDRYQTAAGLRADLVYCMHVLNNERGSTTDLDSTPTLALSSIGLPNTFSLLSAASDCLPSPPLATIAIPATTPATFRSLASSSIMSAAAAGVVEAFKVGKMDLNSIFRVSQKLYGRDEQVAVLLSAFDRVSRNGRVELVLVSGFSGIGKVEQQCITPHSRARDNTTALRSALTPNFFLLSVC